jgi:hypothetical protein
MRKLSLLAVLAVLVVATAAIADSFFSRSTSTANAASAACSTLAPTAGVDVSGARGYTVVATADGTDGGTQAFLGAGTIACCYFGAITTAAAGVTPMRRWMRCPSTLDVSMTASTGQKDIAGGSFETPAGAGRIAYVPQAVTMDAGNGGGGTGTIITTITVRKAP